MADGQESDIPISAGIEVESENTVVSINQPTFLYKPTQKYNNLIGNSVKYEGDGWFIDWKHITIGIEVAGFHVSPQDIDVVFYKDYGDYIYVSYTNGVSFYISNGRIIEGTVLSWTRVNDRMFMEVDFFGDTFTLEIDAQYMTAFPLTLPSNLQYSFRNYDVNKLELVIQSVFIEDKYIRIQYPYMKLWLYDNLHNNNVEFLECDYYRYAQGLNEYGSDSTIRFDVDNTGLTVVDTAHYDRIDDTHVNYKINQNGNINFTIGQQVNPDMFVNSLNSVSGLILNVVFERWLYSWSFAKASIKTESKEDDWWVKFSLNYNRDDSSGSYDLVPRGVFILEFESSWSWNAPTFRPDPIIIDVKVPHSVYLEYYHLRGEHSFWSANYYKIFCQGRTVGEIPVRVDAGGFTVVVPDQPECIRHKEEHWVPDHYDSNGNIDVPGHWVEDRHWWTVNWHYVPDLYYDFNLFLSSDYTFRNLVLTLVVSAAFTQWVEDQIVHRDNRADPNYGNSVRAMYAEETDAYCEGLGVYIDVSWQTWKPHPLEPTIAADIQPSVKDAYAQWRFNQIYAQSPNGFNITDVSNNSVNYEEWNGDDSVVGVYSGSRKIISDIVVKLNAYGINELVQFTIPYYDKYKASTDLSLEDTVPIAQLPNFFAKGDNRDLVYNLDLLIDPYYNFSLTHHPTAQFCTNYINAPVSTFNGKNTYLLNNSAQFAFDFTMMLRLMADYNVMSIIDAVPSVQLNTVDIGSIKELNCHFSNNLNVRIRLDKDYIPTDVASLDELNTAFKLDSYDSLKLWYMYIQYAKYVCTAIDMFLWNKDGVKLISKQPLKVQFDNNQPTYTTTMDNNASAYYVWKSKDIRTGETKLLRSYDQLEYTIHQSHWNDFHEKDCWVIDNDTIYVIGFNNEVSLWKKQYDSSGHPIMDIRQTYLWKKEQTKKFSEWGFSERFGCSDAYNKYPMIWSLSVRDATKLVLKYAIANPNSLDLQFQTCIIPLMQQDFVFNNVMALEMLPPYFDAYEIYNVARISCTVKANGQFIFGIALDKVLKQWALTISGSSISKVVLGFGFVGVDGTLTGCVFPLQSCSQIGFNAIVDKSYIKNSILYRDGELVFTIDFTSLVIAIDANDNLISVPYQQTTRMRNNGNADLDTRIGTDLLIYGTANYVMVNCESRGCAFTDVGFAQKSVSNVAGGNEVADVVIAESVSDSSTDLDKLNRMNLAAGIAGAASSNLTSAGSAQNVGKGISDLVQSTAQVVQESNGKNVISASQSVVRSRLDGYYKLNQSSHIYAGKGFIQIQNVEFLNYAFGSVGNALYVKEALGGDIMRLIVVPLPSGLSVQWVHVAGEPTTYGFSSGILTGSLLRSIPYNRMGYAHSYVNYPTKDAYVYKQSIKRITDDNKDYDITAGSESYSITLSDYKMEDFYQNALNIRASIIYGSNIDYTQSLSAKQVKADEIKPPEFSDPFIYDYCVSPDHDLYYTALSGEIIAVSIKDTKVLDGVPSNIICNNNSVLIGSPYCALEILKPSKYSLDILRPLAITPQSLLINSTGYNCIHGDRIYHACDAYSNRVIHGSGATGSDIEELNKISTYRADDDFKISSIYPEMALYGKFSSAFSVAYNWIIEWNTSFYKSLKASAEDPALQRYSIPMTFKRLALLPTAIKTYGAYKLNVVEGVTSLTTDIRGTLPESRRPDAIDFLISSLIYRWNPEYISSVLTEYGVSTVKDLVATLGLIYIGATPNSALFYSEAVRCFYKFSPNTVSKEKNADLYKKVSVGAYDFVMQEIVFDPITDRGRQIVRSNDNFLGHIVMPNETIYPKGNPLYDDLNGFYIYSMAGGFVLQGLKRFQVCRFLITDDMVSDIKANANKWSKVEGREIDDFWKPRKYTWDFNFQNAPFDAVNGWFHEPFSIATSYLGISDTVEAKFEWLINFAMPSIMYSIIKDKYITVYFAAETMTVGGVVRSKVSSLRLYASLFTRTKDIGYYSYKFNANNGIGDSERLFMWTDGLCFVRSIKNIATSKTSKRISILANYEDSKQMVSF